MITRPPASFDHAERFFSDLNDRQIEVLQLLTRNKTNGEIADELGMTLAGAKWNVSEILTKLGLDGREEAARFYRWHCSTPNRARQLLRALFTGGLLKVTAAAASTAAVVGAATVLVIAAHGGMDDHGPNSPGAPFYLEAHIRRSDVVHESDQRADWWYSDPTHGRQQISAPAIVSLAKGVPAGSISYGSSGASTYVVDGTFAWSGGSPQYLRRLIPPGPATAQWTIGGSQIGPLPDTSIDAFIARLQEPTGVDPVKIVRAGRVLGRDVVVVEQAPAAGTGEPPRATRYWVDESRMFVMKSEMDSGDGQLRITTTVTKLRYGAPQNPANFVWSPDPGAVEITCTVDPVSGPQIEPPSGFLAIPPGAIPAGLVSTGVGTGAGRDGTCAEVHIQAYAAGGSGAPGEPFLHVGENREKPDSVFTGGYDDLRPLHGGDVSAFAWVEGDVRLLAWDYQGLGVQLKSNSMSMEDLVALAEAMLGQ